MEVIDTPHGKLRKAPEGGDLGSFKGEKVKAEMDFPDGHKAKNLESGKCAICSNCQKIKDKFGDQLALKKNDQLSADLKKVEADLEAKPGDPDLIAKQKAMHDDLEMQLYKDTVPNGGLTDGEIKTKLDDGKVFDPNTKRFGDKSKSHSSKRKEYMGSNPSKSSKVGDKVKAKMEAEGYYDFGPPEMFKSLEDGKWHDVELADMSHKTPEMTEFPPQPVHQGSAVEYWNSEGKKFGQKSDEVRNFMNDPDNYYLELKNYNRRDGANLGLTYDDPL
ncbi:MAG: hypothetical protein COA38_02910 [Fluviicola sp.]|nr:MAG: hypothetical protein COA38_02910 [Fluviicola sp.]